jgi:hypothetical protein
MTGGLRFPELCVPAVSRQPALILRPWRAADIPALAAEMSHGYLLGGMWPGPGERPVRTALPGGTERRTGPAGERDASRWLASQDRGWRDGDRLSFAVLEADDAGGCDAARWGNLDAARAALAALLLGRTPGQFHRDAPVPRAGPHHAIPAYLRDIVGGQANAMLVGHGISEPLRWEPPARWAGQPAWPGIDPATIDTARFTSQVRGAVTDAGAARTAGISRPHARLFSELTSTPLGPGRPFVLAELLPPAVRSAEAFTDPPGARLFPEEEAVIRRAVSKRRREFTTARACARAALADLGVPAVPILPGERGEPQ